MIGNVRRVSVISCRDFIAFRKLRVDMIFDMTSITTARWRPWRQRQCQKHL